MGTVGAIVNLVFFAWFLLWLLLYSRRFARFSRVYCSDAFSVLCAAGYSLDEANAPNDMRRQVRGSRWHEETLR